MGIKIIEAKRTPIGKFLGSLYECDPSDVCVQTIDGLFKEANVLKKDVEMTILGNAITAGLGQGISRKIALNAGLPLESPAYLVSMVCGSGMQAVINACNEIKLGKHLVLTGGFEFMSNIPYATDTYLRLGKKFGDFKMTDLMTHDGLIDSFSGVHMGITAENIAKDLHISREQQDKYAFESEMRAINAVTSGYFDDEIIKINLKDYKGNNYVFEKDEHFNPNTSLEKLSSLKTAFVKDGSGTVTAGNSSGINDGAAFLLLASEEYCINNKIDAKVEIIGSTTVGCDPQKMGLGPFYAIKNLLIENGLKFTDIDLFEINEAFAAQTLGCFALFEKEYGVDEKYIMDRTNISGSGLGLGHPLGCSGSRIIVTLYHQMLKRNAKYGIASLCVGGGMGVAVLLKKVD